MLVTSFCYGFLTLWGTVSVLPYLLIQFLNLEGRGLLSAVKGRRPTEDLRNGIVLHLIANMGPRLWVWVLSFFFFLAGGGGGGGLGLYVE